MTQAKETVPLELPPEEPLKKETLPPPVKIEEERGITIKRSTIGKWSVMFEGKISQRDMNHLKRVLSVEFAKERRRRARAYRAKE